MRLSTKIGYNGSSRELNVLRPEGGTVALDDEIDHEPRIAANSHAGKYWGPNSIAYTQSRYLQYHESSSGSVLQFSWGNDVVCYRISDS